MKINPVRAFIIISLAIILLYTLGLFLPIIKNTKDSRIHNLYKIEVTKRIVQIPLYTFKNMAKYT